MNQWTSDVLSPFFPYHSVLSRRPKHVISSKIHMYPYMTAAAFKGHPENKTKNGHYCLSISFFAFIALMLLVGRREEHPASKNWVVRYWHGYLSGARCKWFAYGIWSSWCHCHPIICCSSKIQNGLPFWCRLTQVVWKKRSLNGCCSSSSSSSRPPRLVPGSVLVSRCCLDRVVCCECQTARRNWNAASWSRSRRWTKTSCWKPSRSECSPLIMVCPM